MYFSAPELYKYAIRNNGRVDDSIYSTILNATGVRVEYDGYGRIAEHIKQRHPFTVKLVRNGLRQVKKNIANRDGSYRKWWRPWGVVPKLRNFSAPVGDYGVGVEVELGFVSLEAARTVANHIKDWKYITLDYEGGMHPIEATFPPCLYSKFGNKSQVVRYLKFLSENPHLVAAHDPRNLVGTHVNVSKGGRSNYDSYRMMRINNIVTHELSESEKVRYFGRLPYGTLYDRGSYVEMKLFNSTIDPQILKRYVNIAVSIMDLLTSNCSITREALVEFLERGYNGRIPTNVVAA